MSTVPVGIRISVSTLLGDVAGQVGGIELAQRLHSDEAEQEGLVEDPSRHVGQPIVDGSPPDERRLAGVIAERITPDGWVGPGQRSERKVERQPVSAVLEPHRNDPARDVVLVGQANDAAKVAVSDQGVEGERGRSVEGRLTCDLCEASLDRCLAPKGQQPLLEASVIRRPQLEGQLVEAAGPVLLVVQVRRIRHRRQ